MTEKTEMTSGINYEVLQSFIVSLDEKRKSNLKSLKYKILQVNNFLLFALVLFSYWQRAISKHLALFLVMFQ